MHSYSASPADCWCTRFNSRQTTLHWQRYRGGIDRSSLCTRNLTSNSCADALPPAHEDRAELQCCAIRDELIKRFHDEIQLPPNFLDHLVSNLRLDIVYACVHCFVIGEVAKTCISINVSLSKGR